jgi:hypothetical protein
VVLLPIVKLPEQVNVPVLIVKRHLLLLLPELTVVNDPHTNIPSPTAIVLSLFPPVGGLTVKAPVTVRVIPELICKVVYALAPFMVKDKQVLASVTVTVAPAAMVTSSPAPGTTPPLQVVVNE